MERIEGENVTRKKSIKWKVVLLIIGLIISLVGTSILQMSTFEKQASPREISPQTRKTVVFYRDDCPDCQSVFPLLYYHNLFKKDLIFVNMNQPLNRRYIRTYNLKSVPTIVKKNRQYSGTDKEKIRRFLDNDF
ncbi:hypothetical protein A5865_001285 [Enterococcus sp. 12E11_DIV0728]|nr:hypothetical protein A5865_001285 [Enterococcus sp. 12E11_DIV0728]OUZ16413.1 hypothetical protein A5868_001334 [Enterococcus sp. 12F9_DIV0723]